MSTFRSAYALRKAGRPLIVGDEIFFGTKRHRIVEATSEYYLDCIGGVNDWIFDILDIKKPVLYCNLPEDTMGIFPYHKTLGHLTATVDNLLIDFYKRRLNVFSWRDYPPSGSIKDIPIEYIRKMCWNQVLQGNLFNIAIFEDNRLATQDEGGFDWNASKEGYTYWAETLSEYIQVLEKSDTVATDAVTPEIITLKRNNTKTLLTL